MIERDLFVKDGLLTLPHGTQYRILVLPKLETMRPELLAKIGKLIETGVSWACSETFAEWRIFSDG